MAITNITEFLKGVPIFSSLEESEIQIMKDAMEQRRLKKDEILFGEGEEGDGLYIVVFGMVKIVKDIDGVNKKTLAGMSDGDFFGEMALIDGSSRSASAISSRDGLCLKLSNQKFNNLMQGQTYTILKVVLNVAAYLSVRLRKTNIDLAALENYRILKEGGA